MKTLLRYAWPVPLTALLEYAIVRVVKSNGGAMGPIRWWAIAASLAIVAALQWIAYWQDRKWKRFIEEQRKRLTDVMFPEGHK